MKKSVELDISYRLINHGCIVLVSSLYNGKPGITPIAWLMPISKDPPQIALAIWEGHFIYKCIMQTKDFVVNVPDKSMLKIVLKCGKISGKDVDKFKKYNLKKEPSKKIKSPRLAESVGFLECVLVEDRKLAVDHNIILGEVKYAEAEGKAFNKRWLFENKEYKTLHHLGNKIFSIPADGVLKG